MRTQGGLPARILRPSFKENLFKGIFEQNKGFQKQHEATEDLGVVEAKMIEKLDNYAVERWESVLKYIVNPKDAKNQVCNTTKDVLKFAGLMKSVAESDESSNGGDNVVLTASAFQFLLWNRKLQIWYFMIQLLEFCWKNNNQDLSECLNLLFELSFSTFGKVKNFLIYLFFIFF